MTMLVPAPGQIRHMLGGQISVKVEVDTGGGEGLGALWDEGLWDTNRWGSEDPDWVDMSAYVLSVSIHQGSERWGERAETGTASVVVDNTTGIFSPESGVPDPWFREFRPGRRIRVVTIPDPDTGVRVPLFTGRFDAIEGHLDDAGHAITATLQAFDFMGDWASYNPFETTDTGNQRTDVRVGAALDRYGWPTDERDLQVGDHNVTGSTLANTTLEECQQAADAEGGYFYCSKDGLATFKSKDWLTTDTRSTVIQGYVGYMDIPEGIETSTPFVTSYTPTSLRADTGIYVGMTIQVGASPLVVTELGRWVVAGNSLTHPIKLVVGATGIDIPGATVTVDCAGATPGQFLYGTLATPVTLAAGTQYHLVHTNVPVGLDYWYEVGSPLGHTTAATIVGPCYHSGGTSYGTPAAPDYCYGPVSFKYQTAFDFDDLNIQMAHAADPATSWELARVVNHAAYAREGGIAQESADLGSQAKYGLRSLKRTDLHNTTDGEVLALAVRTVNSLKDLRPRLDEITVIGVDDPDNEDLNRLLWDTELGDLLAVQLTTPWGWFAEREVHVVAMDHAITADEWTVRFRLDDAQTIDLTYWILEDPIFGVLNETTRAA